ncbi:hypothetical protein BN14_07998 [Rhizoctonia solani AG-1 IB]|uniref:F-box domain-containing protein n=1 Tax=Thanatephorus cucumeris (strain AG1-IB / isolate 7/3/14) TaxID=1108050 RepID=M5C3B2_THACB|nr:hypothetical protein BN14_07998 [Rhizoctonia solani AG-1 IB]
MSKADSKDTEPKRNNVTRKAQSRSINTLPYEILFDIFIDYDFSPQQFRALDDHWHRFRVIDIWTRSEDAPEIYHTLSAIIKHCPPGSISKLSLRREKSIQDIFTLYTLTQYEPSISTLISSLEVFRIGNFSIDWSRISFSDKLVELRLADTDLRNSREILSFMAALSSARELRELKLVSVAFWFDQECQPLNPPISLPKLEHLHLEQMHLNGLDFFLSSIAPGSYQLALNPLEGIFSNYSVAYEEPVDEDRVCEFFKRHKVHKLILWGQRRFFWTTKAGLVRLLQATPSVKTLVMNYYPFNPDTISALKRPPRTTNPKNKLDFPILTRLHIHGAYVELPLAQLKSSLDDAIDSHRIERMEFGGQFVLDQRVPITVPLDESDEVFDWLRRKVPHFTKSCEPSQASEATDMWRLWDM